MENAVGVDRYCSEVISLLFLHIIALSFVCFVLFFSLVSLFSFPFLLFFFMVWLVLLCSRTRYAINST